MRVAVIGAGMSGLAAARVMMRLGHEVVVYERSAVIGGVWALSYPEVRLQNVAEHYRLSDFPWPDDVDLHPTAQQILAYMERLAAHFGVDVRLNHEVISLGEQPDGWDVEVESPAGRSTSHFGHVVASVGHYSGEKHELMLPGREGFAGGVLTERDVHHLNVFGGKRVAVVGFGKSAVDMATLAAKRARSVAHVFRAPRWLMPRLLMGRHMADVVSARVSTSMALAWAHPWRSEAIFHKWFRPSVWMYWKGTEWLFRAATGLHSFWIDRSTRARMKALEPDQPLTYQMRAAAAMAPDEYYPLVRSGEIEPIRGEVAGLNAEGIQLADGRTVAADVVVLAVGHKPPPFSFLPERYRTMMTAEPDGAQLYRHVIHPRIPHLSFAGFNHAFLHVAAVEVAMLWVGAVLAGDLLLPPVEEMENRTHRVAAWKRKYTLFEPTRAWGIGGRFHQYFDVLLQELGVNPKRKRNWLAELAEPYFSRDYGGVFDEYRDARKAGTWPRPPIPIDM